MSHTRNRQYAGVLITGGGISGICTAIELIRRNNFRDFVIVEKSSQFGGTWNDNTYPGCCCDIWSHLYSFSFAPNSSWTREFAEQEEIHQYLIRVAENWGLYQKARFNTEVEEARWDETKNNWKVKLRVGGGKEAEYGEYYTMTCDYLVSGVGQLNNPYYPKIPGLETFKHKIMHSARWDWTHSLEGKKVGIIGSGATAAQIIPEVAKVCNSLTVFQRTPNWVSPRGDRPISATRQLAFRYLPWIRKLYRSHLMDVRESYHRVAAVLDSNEGSSLKQDALDHLACQIPDDIELREKLTPGYPVGCKRVIMSDDLYPALNQPHVTLETASIDSITSNGIQVPGKEYDLDVLILATGFRTTEFLYPIKVYGLGGKSMEDIWKDGPCAFLGITVESLPNFAMLYGPNTNLGHNSIILMIEAQARYISAMLAPMLKARANGQAFTIIPKSDRLKEYNASIQARLNASTFAHPSCNSWYKTSDGVVTNNWCGTAVEYQKLLSTVDWDDYEVSGYSQAFDPRNKVEKVGRVVEEAQVPFIGLSTIMVVLAAIVAGIVSKSSFFVP